MRVAGYTSTGSKRPGVLWGGEAPGAPQRMRSAVGCRVTAENGCEYLDWIMGLGAVALGYSHPVVTEAVIEEARRGVTGPLPPMLEEEVASLLAEHLPHLERVRFLKTGAEALAAAVRLARVATGRPAVLGCGYHGWLDWCSDADGVPDSVRADYGTIPFNDLDRGRDAIRRAGDRLACLVVEPMVDGAASKEWLGMLRDETDAIGALLVLDEIKTAFRIALGGVTERHALRPDLVVLGKALANGFPLAVVGGRMDVMERVDRTWISSTLATESVSLAAARATIEVMVAEQVPARLADTGGVLWDGLHALADDFPNDIAAVPGVPSMCYLAWRHEEIGTRIAIGCAQRGVLWKRSAYNFASLAHELEDVAFTLAALRAELEEGA